MEEKTINKEVTELISFKDKVYKNKCPHCGYKLCASKHTNVNFIFPQVDNSLNKEKNDEVILEPKVLLIDIIAVSCKNPSCCYIIDLFRC